MNETKRKRQTDLRKTRDDEEGEFLLVLGFRLCHIIHFQLRSFLILVLLDSFLFNRECNHDLSSHDQTHQTLTEELSS